MFQDKAALFFPLAHAVFLVVLGVVMLVSAARVTRHLVRWAMRIIAAWSVFYGLVVWGFYVYARTLL